MPLVSLLLAAGIGLVVAGLFHGDVATMRSYPWLWLWLSLGLGCGIASSGLFVWSILFQPSTGYILAELCFLAALTVALACRIATKPRAAPSQTLLETPSSSATSLLRLCFYTLLISSLLSFALLSLAEPHGGWDGWAIWNLRARFIFLGRERWWDGFSSTLAWSHPDYPLLLPALVARSWIYAGENTVLSPVLIAAVFTFATLGLLVSSLGVLRDKSQALIAGMVLMGTPFFLQLGALQQADLPLAFFILATLVLSCLAEHLPTRNNSSMILAGLTAGFFAWTKNEGVLFLLSANAACCALTYSGKTERQHARGWFFFAVGFLPLLAMIVYFKLRLSSFYDPLLTQGLQLAFAKLSDLSRYQEVSKAFLREFGTFGGGIIPISLVLISYALLSRRFDFRRSRALSTGLATLGLVLLGYYFVYVITPYDLDWHLKTSLARLLLQLWPSLIFIFFLFVRPVMWVTKRQDPGIGS